MRVVITSTTENETIQTKSILNSSYTCNKNLEVLFHTSGVGILSSCFAISKIIFEKNPDLIIQAGIAGSFNNNISLGKVVVVKDEILADAGVEENGVFKDLFDLNLQQENGFPFFKRTLSNTSLERFNSLQLEEVTGITVNEVTTRQARIAALKAKYQPEIESMEGASLHYCCLQTSTPFIQIRAISNYVGERDKTKWNFKDALGNLNECVTQYIFRLDSEKNLQQIG